MEEITKIKELEAEISELRTLLKDELKRVRTLFNFNYPRGIYIVSKEPFYTGGYKYRYLLEGNELKILQNEHTVVAEDQFFDVQCAFINQLTDFLQFVTEKLENYREEYKQMLETLKKLSNFS